MPDECVGEGVDGIDGIWEKILVHLDQSFRMNEEDESASNGSTTQTQLVIAHTQILDEEMRRTQRRRDDISSDLLSKVSRSIRPLTPCQFDYMCFVVGM